MIDWKRIAIYISPLRVLFAYFVWLLLTEDPRGLAGILKFWWMFHANLAVMADILISMIFKGKPWMNWGVQILVIVLYSILFYFSIVNFW